MDDLLKDAIADAKAVRETALANAKIALEEAFTPRLQSMLSRKIQSEMDQQRQIFVDGAVEKGADDAGSQHSDCERTGVAAGLGEGLVVMDRVEVSRCPLVPDEVGDGERFVGQRED